MSKPAGSPWRSLCNDGGGITTDILLQRSEVLLSNYSLLLGLEITQSTSHFGPPQPVPGLRLGWQSPPGLLPHWVPSPALHPEIPSRAPLYWRPGGIKRNEVRKAHPETLRHTHFTPDTGSLMKQATYRYVCPHGTTVHAQE